MKQVVARVQLTPTDRGGRRTPISAYGCPVFFADVPELSASGWDCRLSLVSLGRPFSPGEVVDEIPLAFLSPDEVLPHLAPGMTFELWEGRPIGIGTVLRIEDTENDSAFRMT